MSRRSHQAAVSGLKIAKIAAWIFVSCALLSLGNCFPGYSLMYLSALGTVHTSTSGLGRSLNRVSCLECLERFVSTDLGVTKVLSLFLTSSVGSKFRTSPDSISGFHSRPTSDASPEVGVCPLEVS